MNELQELKKLYKDALDQKKESFIFQDKEILTNYAKYLIEYLEMSKDLNQIYDHFKLN